MPDIMQTSIKSLPLVYRGKVRECYAVGEDKLLMIATDRISAFDVILSVPIPKKGKVLTALTKTCRRHAHAAHRHRSRNGRRRR